MNSRWVLVGIAAIALVASSGVNLIGVHEHRAAAERKTRAVRLAERQTEAAVRILHHQWRTTETQVQLLHEMATDLQIAFRLAAGPMGVEVPGEDTAPFKKQELKRAKHIANPDLFTQVTLVDNLGAAIWSTLSGARIRIDLSDREHIHAVLNDGKEKYVGRPVLGRVSGAYTVQFVAANYDHMGHRIGVSVVSLDVVAVRDFLNGMRLGDRDEIAVIRDDGVLVASSRFAHIGKVLGPSIMGMVRNFTVDGNTELHAPVLLLNDLGLERPMMLMAMPVTPKGLSVAVLRDYLDLMTDAEETNRIRARNTRYLQFGTAGVGIALALGLIIMAHIRTLASARRIAEERLRADQHLAMAARLGPGVLYRVGFSATDMPRFDWVSEAVERVLGYDVHEFSKTGMLERIVDADTAAALLDAARSAAQGRSHTMEFRLRRRDGSWLWVHNTLQPCGWQDDRQILVLGYLIDISAAKEQAHMMGQAAKMVTLGEMASGLVHELKLPVATIAIAADNMRHDLETLHVAEGERLRRAVGRISQQAARAARLMKQLTIYARNEQGDDAVSSVIEAVEGAKVLVDYRLRNSGVHLQTDLPDDLPMTVGSLLMLEQVLVNLLVNAVDAYVGTARTSPLVRITARVEGNCVLVTVSDRATGIPPDILKHIFDPFFSTKAAGQGTGLGLSFSRRVVMNMGGTINVNTGPSGTDFHVRLPIAHAGRHAVESVSPECPCRQ